MSSVLVLLFALIQADLPVEISAAGLRNARSTYIPAGGFGVTESPAGSEEEEEDEDDGDMSNKEQVVQLVQAASAQAPDAQQKQAFLAWLAAGRKALAVVSTIEAPTMRPLQVAGSRSQVAAGYPAFQHASPAFDFPSFALREEQVAKGGVAKEMETKASEKAPAESAVEETVAQPGNEVAAEGGSDADDEGGNSTAEGGDQTCHPACAEGRGLCSDRVCFCRSPYTGMSCEKFREGSLRFSYAIAAAILVFAMIIGSILGINTFKLLMGVTADNTTTSSAEAASNTKETWRPAQGLTA